MPTGATKARDSHDPTALGRNFKKRLRRGELLIGGTVSEYARPSLIKLFCQAGFDFLFIENEHVLYGSTDLVDMMICARDNGLPVISKIPQLERASTTKLLDNGCVGIQLPRTQSRQDMETLISFMKFPPLGTRAGAPCFANVDYAWPANHPQWLRRADESTVVVAHIETAEGLRNAEEIIATPHLDMVYVGPYDFSIAMGHPGDYGHPDVLKAMNRILEICMAHNIPFGTTAGNLDGAAYWIKRGVQFFEAVDELSLIAAGARELVDQYRKVSPGKRSAGKKLAR
jgi:2-keto-3-deoxy-L-rhamnonate aldolase RhmA